MKDNFTNAALKEAENCDISDENFQDRELLEGITIDHHSSRDLDDGISYEKTDDGYLLKIAIADPASVIEDFSELFNCALDKAATRYLSYKTVPMLPRILSEKKLSLHPGDPKPAISFEIELNNELTVRHLGIKKILFINNRRLSFDEFDNIIDTENEDPDRETFLELWNLGHALLNMRREQGALAIYDIRKGIYTTEEGKIVNLTEEYAHKSNIVIQELMILANTTAARYFANLGIPLLYRNHTVKQTIPDREELISQFNSALLNPEFLDSFMEKTHFWFEKASYGVEIKGHYGLNEAVYTHLTSPLRRFPDMLNHYQIHSYLANSEFSFSTKELNEFARKINEKMDRIRDEKNEFHLKIRKEQARFSLNYDSAEQFAKMSDGKFKKALEESVKHDLFFRNIKDGILYKIKNNQLNAKHVHIILFEAKKDIDNYQEVLPVVLEYLYENIELTGQILYMEKHLGRINDLKDVIVDTIEGFAGRIWGLFHNDWYTTENYQTGSNKKEVTHKANYDFLIAYMNNTLVKADEAEKIEYDNSEQAEEETAVKYDVQDISSNYVGTLLEIVNRKENWQHPEYHFQLKGASHKPHVTCTCILKLDGETYTSEANGKNKKIAKQAAAKIMLEIIHENDLDQQAEDRQTTPKEVPQPQPKPAQKSAKQNKKKQDDENNLFKVPDKENPIQALNNICQKKNADAPDYTYEEIGSHTNPEFECTVYVGFEGKDFEVSAAAASKKEAKRLAAANCLRKITSAHFTKKKDKRYRK